MGDVTHPTLLFQKSNHGSTARSGNNAASSASGKTGDGRAGAIEAPTSAAAAAATVTGEWPYQAN